MKNSRQGSRASTDLGRAFPPRGSLVLRGGILRVVQAAFVALLCLVVCLASGLSPASARSAEHHQDCQHASASCASDSARQHGDQDAQHRGKHNKRHHHGGDSHSKPPVAPSVTSSPAAPSPVRPPPVSATRVGPTPGGPTTNGGKPTEPGGPTTNGGKPTEPGRPTTNGGKPTESSTPAESATPAVPPSTTASRNSTSAGAGLAAPSAVITQAGAVGRPAAILTSTTANQPPTLRAAPTGGGQLPAAARPLSPTRSAGTSSSASTAPTASSPGSPSPVVAAAFDAPRTESMFGIDSSLLLAATLALFVLGVALMVAAGHRRAHRTH